MPPLSECFSSTSATTRVNASAMPGVNHTIAAPNNRGNREITDALNSSPRHALMTTASFVRLVENKYAEIMVFREIRRKHQVNLGIAFRITRVVSSSTPNIPQITLPTKSNKTKIVALVKKFIKTPVRK
jgi:hypothetical protein